MRNQSNIMKKESNFILSCILLCTLMSTAAYGQTTIIKRQPTTEKKDPSVSQAEFTDEFSIDGLRFRKEKGSSVIVLGMAKDDSPNEKLSIPEVVTYKGKSFSVSKIVNSAFLNNETLTSVVIPNSVIKIGEGAFSGCKKLTSVTLSNCIKEIESEMFRNCSSLLSIKIPGSVTSIGSRAFYSCKNLSSVNIPNNIISIGESAFSGCTSLSSVEIPYSVEEIGEKAFDACSGLSSLKILNNKTRIGKGAFGRCKKISDIVYTSDCFINLPTSHVGQFIIPDGIKTISSHAFWGCRYLRSVSIPNSITTIENDAFLDCHGLTSVSLPNSVTSIERAVFENSGLVSVTIPNCVVSIKSYAFLDSDLESVIIPSSVKSVESQAFWDCKKLVSVTIPSTVIEKVEDGAFQGCDLLDTIRVIYPDGREEQKQINSDWKE